MNSKNYIVRSSLIFISIYGLLILIMACVFYWFQASFTDSAVGFGEALFTSASALTLTGWDTAGFPWNFTSTGNLWLLASIQLGSFYLLASTLYFVKRGRDDSQPPRASIRFAIKNTLIYLLLLEVFATVSVFAFLKQLKTSFDSFGDMLSFAAFTGISALNNAGFVPLKGSMSGPVVQESYLLHLVLFALIVVGSLGYFVLQDLFSIPKLRARMLDPQRSWNLHTRLAIGFTVLLLALGSFLYYFGEIGAVLGREKLVSAAISSMFNVAGSRTAGFYSNAPGMLSIPVLAFYMLLMLIGVSFGSVGGGMRIITVWALFQKTLRRMAFRILLYSLACIIVGWLLLWLFNPAKSAFELLFLQLSAFTNTGLALDSVNVYSGHGVLLLSMLAGRMLIPALAALYARMRE